jgi:hypothetical protein
MGFPKYKRYPLWTRSGHQATAWFEVREKVVSDCSVTLSPDDGTVLVTFADLPEAITLLAGIGRYKEVQEHSL